MNAPLIWIGLPMLLGLILLLVPSTRWNAYLGTFFSALLALVAFLFPTDTLLPSFGDTPLRIDSTLILLGRQLTITSSDQIMLVIIYIIASFWFFGSQTQGNSRRLVPLGLLMISLLVASLAVTPFLYAALFIEMAVLLAVPMLAEASRGKWRGLFRFVIYQTLAMPFILFAGFLLAGIDAGPRDLGLVVQASVLLALGFAFLFSIFPLYTWIPMLAEEGAPYPVAFILSVFPNFHILFGLHFLDRYAWLRDSQELFMTLRFVGLLMLVSAGVWAAGQRHLGRILGYIAVAQIGLSLLALSLLDHALSVQIVFAMMIPRAVALGIWAVGLLALQRAAPSMRFVDLQGAARRYPFATAAIFLAHISLVGVPLLAGFPPYLALWQKLAAEALAPALWMAIANIGLWIPALRTLAVLNMAPNQAPWQSQETMLERVLLGVGCLVLFGLGVFPQWATPLLANLPFLFQNLGN